MAQAPVDVKTTAPARRAPADPWQALRTEMDNLFDRFTGGFGFPALRNAFDIAPPVFTERSFGWASPAVDVTEDEKSYKIAAELPGLSEKDIEVSVSGDTLVLKGEKRHEQERKDENRHISERAYGAFQRSFGLPDGIDRDKISAGFSKGVLTVTIPKSAEAQKARRTIEVKAS